MCFDADLEVVAHTQLLNSVVFLLAGEASAVASIPLDRVLLHKKKAFLCSLEISSVCPPVPCLDPAWNNVSLALGFY